MFTRGTAEVPLFLVNPSFGREEDTQTLGLAPFFCVATSAKFVPLAADERSSSFLEPPSCSGRRSQCLVLLVAE